MALEDKLPNQSSDVAIHCGDLTEESKFEEFRVSLRLLSRLDAPLKLVISGNHDFTLDTPIFKQKVNDAGLSLEAEGLELVRKEYGTFEEARRMLRDAQSQGIHFLDEGTHRFKLANGAALTVYASPYTPSLGDWGFQYRPANSHDYNIEEGTNVVITHGPPLGILDRTDSCERAGSSELFEAVARVKPLIHTFGHIYESWGAKLVAWRPTMSERPSHLIDIDNENSRTIELLSTSRRNKFASPETAAATEERLTKLAQQKCRITSHGLHDKHPLRAGEKTLFVNAAIKGDGERETQLPWLIEVDLPQISG